MNDIKQGKKLSKLLVPTLLITVLILILPSNSITAESSFSDLLAEAILADPSCLLSSTYSDTDNYGNRQATILSSLGTMNATDGGSFVLLSTGISGSVPMTSDANNPGSERGEWFVGGQYPRKSWPYTYDRATLTMNLLVPDNMHYLYYDIQFYSTEYPDYVGSNYNDKITVTVNSPSEGTSTYVIDVNNGHFVLDSNSIPGTGFDIFATDGNPNNRYEEVDMVDTNPEPNAADAGATALHTEGGHPVSPNEQITVIFEIKDEYDNQFDSSAFIDNLIFAEYARPVLEATKTVEDLSGGDVASGDILKYTVTVSNTGIIDQSNNPGNELEDVIPENAEYISNSITATSGVATYDSNQDKILWNGNIPGDSSVVITFKVQISDDVASNTLISNQADIYWDKNNDGSNEEYLTTGWANVTVHNSPPVAVNDSVSLDEDSIIYFDVLSNDYDPLNQEIEIYNYSIPTFGTIELAENGSFEFIPELNYFGQDSFTYTIIRSSADGEGNLDEETDTALVTLTINPVNDMPLIDYIPGQTICDGEDFAQINLDEYVYDPDNSDDELSWSVYTARTIWIEVATGRMVASNHLDWVTIENRAATVTYPSDPSEWGRPGSADDYISPIDGALFVFKPQFNVEDPGGLTNYESSVGNFTVYSTYEPPTMVNETFANDEPGGIASESYKGREWFSTGIDGVGCNFEVSESFSLETANSFKTKLRQDGTPLYWYYDLESLETDILSWEIWFYCGKTSEYSDVYLEFKGTDGVLIAKILIDYVDGSENPLNFVPQISCWDGSQWRTLMHDLDNGWYKLRLERNESKIDYLIYNSNQDQSNTITCNLGHSFSTLSEVVWRSEENAVVCPMFFWDDHRLELEPLTG